MTPSSKTTMAAHESEARRPVTAVVMNLFCTGLGIARSLGEHGIPVIGLSAQRGVYGNFSRYAKTMRCADSRKEPEALLTQLLELGARLGHRAILFPTRDHDLVFLDRFRRELEPHFVLVVASREALERCLNKWETYSLATQAGVPTPKSWLVEDANDLRKAAGQVTYPCVLKPVAAHHWRTADNWALVGGRKAIAVASAEELLAEYAVIAGADPRALIQEAIPGADDCLIVTACYIDRQSRFQAAFNIQKLVQTPPGFGTGCIVQSANRPELLDRTIRLLQAMEFTGVAEVEYKWDARDDEYKLIEVNPRPWDQHRLGAACGVDLMYLAYCDGAGFPQPAVHADLTPRKWVAEDAFILTALRLIWRREPGLGALVRQARGERVCAIWSATDPLPFIGYLASLVAELFRMGLQVIRRSPAGRAPAPQKPAMRASQ